MNNPTNQLGSVNPRDFWDSLHLDILTSNQKTVQEDDKSLIERSFLYSLFFRGCHPFELIGFRRILNIKDNGCVLILNFTDLSQSGTNEDVIDEYEIYQYLRDQFINKNICIGPLIISRICLLISDNSSLSSPESREAIHSLCEDIITGIKESFHLNITISVGSPMPINAVYTSFLDALSAQYSCNSEPILYYKDGNEFDNNARFDYLLAEKHMIESIRLRKSDAFDYFDLIMNYIRSYSDEARRNKILEILVLSNHAMSLDSQNETSFFDYTGIAKEFSELSGDALLESAYQKFIFLTSYVKPQNNIDYTNNIVKVTKEYLESHYAEDISLEDAAEQVNISPQYFSKLIKKTTGFNFIDWLSMLRVKKAKELLTNSNLTVKEVCFMVGYKDPNYFSRIFKKRIGITPSEYVKKQLLF
jgi:two-component system response regulator YesN